MPEKRTTERARRALEQGRSPSTAAGEFVREEMAHVRQGKHGARSPKRAIAIGLSKARREGLPIAPPRKGRTGGSPAARKPTAPGRKTRPKLARVDQKRTHPTGSDRAKEPRIRPASPAWGGAGASSAQASRGFGSSISPAKTRSQSGRGSAGRRREAGRPEKPA